MIQEFTMPNGLKVIGIESHKSPVVSVQMWVRNGSADEEQKDQGLSHFIEHLVFKGTEKYKVGEIAAKVESCGGELNAYTSFDQTVFYVTISKNFYKVALDVVSQMMSKPLFEGDEIDREREVVIEEIKRSEDSLSRQASRQMFETLYEGHPYSIPVIGYEEIIRTVPHERIRSFFKERYAAQNMFLVVTGDFDPKSLEKDVQKYFSQVEDGPIQMPERLEVPVIDESRVAVKESSFEESVFYLSWPTVDILHEDLAALEVLSLILGQGGSSRLNMALRIQQSLVNYIGCGCWSPKYEGFFTVTGSLNRENFAPVLENIKTVMEEFLRAGPTEEELRKAKINFLSDEAYGLETVGGLARKFGGNFDLSKNLYLHKDFYKKLETITCEQVRKIAEKYLVNERLVATAVVPKGGDEVKKLLNEWKLDLNNVQTASTKSVSVKVQSAKNQTAGGDETKEYTLDSGAKVLVRKDNSAPIFNLRMASLGGSRLLTDKNVGLTELLRRSWVTSTSTYSEEELRNELDSMASSLYAFSGRNTVGLVLDGLSSFEDSLADVFVSAFTEPLWAENVLEREKNQIYESLRSRTDNPAQMAILEFQQRMFDKHPYALDTLGSEKTLSGMGAPDLQAYLSHVMSSDNMMFALSGDCDVDAWLDRLQALTSNLGSSGSVIKHKNLSALESDEYAYLKAQKEQTHIVYGYRGLSISHEDRFVLQVIEAILAGQGGRLFIELRDKESLAYSVSPIKMSGLETGYFAAYIGCSPEKSQQAIDMMEIEFAKLCDSKVPEEEISRAKNYLIGSHDIHLQKNSSLSSSILFTRIYGQEMSEVFSYSSYLENITAEDIQRVSQSLFKQKKIISLVGPNNIFN